MDDRGSFQGLLAARRWALRLITAAIILGHSSTGRAVGNGDIYIASGATAVNVAFLTAGLAASRGQPVGGLNVLQLLLGAPQTAAFNTLVAINAEKGDHDSVDRHLGALLLMAPAITGTTLMTYGSLSLGEMESLSDRLGLAAASGINLALTASLLGSAADGRTSPPTLMYTQLALTTPMLALELSQAASGGEEVASWIAMTVWSGGLFLHGVASWLIDQDLEYAGVRSAPSRIAVMPTMISDGHERHPGLMLGGVW